MLQEISRRSIQLSKYEDIDVVWHNDVLTVRCDSGFHLFNFSYNLKCLDKTIDFCEAKIPTSKCSPATELFPENALMSRIRNADLSQMIVDPALWPHNKLLMDVTITTTFEWSPVDFIHNNECALATVNSSGNVDLYAQERNKWKRSEDLSQKLKDEMILNNLIPSVSFKDQIDVDNVKKAAYAVETNSICWSPDLNADKSCYFVTAQKNCHIIFWSLTWGTSGIDVKLLHNITESRDEIITMKWIPTSDGKFLLVCSNVLGQIWAYECEIVNNVLKHLNTHKLWPHRDRLIAHYIQYEIVNDNIMLACSKHRHFLLLMIDKNCNVLLQNITNIHDQKITAVVKNGNKLYVSLVSRDIYEVKYYVENESIQVRFIQMEMKLIPSMYELCSLAFSTNNTILAVALLDRTVLYRKAPLTLDIVLYVEESPDSELLTIINNPTKTLTNFWDIIESLRCKTLKSKMLPSLDYNELYSKATTDVYFLKLYLVLSTFYNSLEISIQNGSRGMLPEKSVDFVKSKILAHHAVELITSMYESLVNKKHIENNTGYESLVMASIYLEEFCKKYEQKLDDMLPPNVLSKLHNVSIPQYTCQWCDETLKGFICKGGHINAFCSITFTPIESNDYLVCRSCSATVRSDLYLDKPKCVYCDLHLCNCYLPS